jgi:putative copper resistance protein D
MVAAAWTLAAAVLVLLAVSVARHVDAGAAHHGMSMTSTALYRQGAGPSGPLLGRALLTAWHLDAVAVAFLVLLGALYATGVARVRRLGRRWPAARTVSFVLGLLVTGYATCGAIAVYDMALFSAHMIGHLLLIMVAPALLVAGRPLRLATTGREDGRPARLLRSAPVALLTSPPVALASYAVVIVGTHLTGFMDAVMRSAALGQLEHLLYLVVGVQFFLLVVGDEPIRWRLGIPLRWLFLALAMAVDTFTGIVLMQGTDAVALVPSALQISALSDTRTGGAIMWFGGDAIMLVIMIALVVDYLRHVEAAPAERGWLAQARVATFSAHTGTEPAETRPADGEEPGVDLDSDDAAREAYNRWLAKLASRQ